MTVTPRVSVVVPVYGGAAETGRCLASVLDHAPALTVPFELLIIDDACPDPAVRAELDRVAAEPAPVAVTLLRNPENRRLRGLGQPGLRHADGDVVVLNADTVVTAGWLDASGRRRPGRGRRHRDAADQLRLDLHAAAARSSTRSSSTAATRGSTSAPVFVRQQSLGLRPEVITGVGFCMYVTRGGARPVRPLRRGDVRAGLRRGGRLLPAGHAGWASATSSRTPRSSTTGAACRSATSGHEGMRAALGGPRRALPVLPRRPTARERADDPARRRRSPPSSSALAERDPARPHVLHVLHRPLDRRRRHREARRWRCSTTLGDEFDFSVLYPVESGFVLRPAGRCGGPSPIAHEFLLPGGAAGSRGIHDAVAAEALPTVPRPVRRRRRAHPQPHRPLARPARGARRLPRPGRLLGARPVPRLPELLAALPQHRAVRHPRRPRRAAPGACPRPSEPPVDQLEALPGSTCRRRTWRRVDHWVFAEPERGRLPPAGLRRSTRTGSRSSSTARPSTRTDRGGSTSASCCDEPLRVAFVGRGWAKKGLDAVNQLADAFAGLRHRDPPLRPAQATRRHRSLRTHGAYDNEVLPELLHRAGIQVVLLPGAYAETFGIVMSEALAAGLPVIGAGYGALGERIRARGWAGRSTPSSRTNSVPGRAPRLANRRSCGPPGEPRRWSSDRPPPPLTAMPSCTREHTCRRTEGGPP